MAQYPLSGSPPFNPYLPDPRQPPPQPLGVPQGFPSPPAAPTPASVPQGPQAPLGAPPQGPAPQGAVPQAPGQGPRGSALSRFLLGIGDVSAAAQGRPGPSDELRQQRIQDFQLKRQELAQNLALIGQFSNVLENTPVDQLEGRRAKLREAFGKLAPGQEDLYDLITSDVGLSGATLETLRNNDAVKMILATGGSTADVLDFVRSEPGQKSVQEMNDRVALPAVKRKFDALRNSTDERVRGAIAKAAKDGLTTIEEMVAISEEFGTDGPDGTRITASERGAALRNQGVLSQTVPGLTTTSDFEAEADLQRKLRLEQEKNKGTDKQTSILERQVLFEAYKQGNKDIEATEGTLVRLSDIDQTFAEAERVINEGKARTGFIEGRNIPLAAQKVFSEQEINIIDQAFGNQLLQSVEQLRGLGQMSDKDLFALQQTTGGTTKDEAFNLSDLQRRRAAITRTLEAKRTQRRIAVQNRQNIADRLKLGDVLDTKGTEDVEAPRAETPAAPAAAAQVGETRTTPDGIVLVKRADGQWVRK